MGVVGSKILGTKIKPGRLVELDIGGEAVTVELRAPNLAARAEIARAAGLAEAFADETHADMTPDQVAAKFAGKVDLPALTAHVLLRCAYEPSTIRRVFSLEQLPALLELPPEYDALQVAALEVFRGQADPVGESAATPS